MTRALLTGFGPFPGAPFNPTASVIERAARLAPQGVHVETLVLETCFDSVPARLAEAAAHAPDIVVMTGLALGAERVRLERRARNDVLPGRADAAGATRQSGRADAHGPETRETSADLDAAARALAQAGLGYDISRDAGRYVCEFAYFHALGLFAAARVIFVHLPMTQTDGATRRARTLSDAEAAPREAEIARAVNAVLASQC